MKPESAEIKYHAPAVEKALDILEFMAVHPGAVSLKQLSDELQKSPGELFRIVDCLIRRGYIIKDHKQNLLSLSLKMFDLANGHPQFKVLLEVAERPFVTFCEDTRTDCHLSVLDGCNLFVLHGYESSRFYSIRIKTGSRFPAWQVNSGRLLLARLPQAKRQQLLDFDPSFRAIDAAQQQEIIQAIDALKDEVFLMTKSLKVPVIDDIIVPFDAPHFGADVMAAVPLLRGEYTPQEKDRVLKKLFETVTAVSESLRQGMGGI